MEKKTRRKYAPEFKREAIELASHPDQTAAGVAKDLGIRENLLRRWKNKIEPHGKLAFGGQGVVRDEKLMRQRHELPHQVKRLDGILPGNPTDDGLAVDCELIHEISAWQYGLDALGLDPSPKSRNSWNRRRQAWKGIPITVIDDSSLGLCMSRDKLERERGLGNEHWTCLDDTFPSNMALFRPENVSVENGHCGVLNLRREEAYVRSYTSAAISSCQRYLYGKFDALIKLAAVPGVITGMFLHRSSPRQEIDIEFLGRESRKMLVNVFYNPGIEGSKFDYGYRGTPILIDLGFDAAEDFHQYSIEWSATYMRWFVDGRLVHERSNWEPTPIPHLPMQLYMNLWASRSRELTGRLAEGQLPTRSFIKCVEWCAWATR